MAKCCKSNEWFKNNINLYLIIEKIKFKNPRQKDQKKQEKIAELNKRFKGEYIKLKKKKYELSAKKERNKYQIALIHI